MRMKNMISDLELVSSRCICTVLQSIMFHSLDRLKRERTPSPAVGTHTANSSQFRRKER